MPHYVEELATEAARAIEAMRQAALAARHAHARAELMRHMLGTARKAATRPRREAIDQVVREWMDAWMLDRAAVAQEMEALTAAFLDYAATPGDAADAALRQACTALDQALARTGTTISDEMAWRSQCAHGWWSAIRPPPPGLPARPEIPPLPTDAPFWTAACPERCR